MTVKLLIGTSNGVFVAGESGKPTEVEGLAGHEVGGVLGTSDDGGHWTSVMTGGDIHVMAGDPAEPDVLYATTGFGRYPDDPQPREERVAGAFRSRDGGQNWEYLWKDCEPPY